MKTITQLHRFKTVPERNPSKSQTAAEIRKTTKPIMEKRRRARINESLNQLKILILDALKKDSSRHSKLEKADILEMTVKYLSNLKRSPETSNKFLIGYKSCMTEVSKYMSISEHVDLGKGLLVHLTDCVSVPSSCHLHCHEPSFGQVFPVICSSVGPSQTHVGPSPYIQCNSPCYPPPTSPQNSTEPNAFFPAKEPSIYLPLPPSLKYPSLLSYGDSLDFQRENELQFCKKSPASPWRPW